MGRQLRIHEVMRSIVNDYGVEVLTEPRLAGLMADILGGEYVFYPVIRRSIQTRIGQRIVALLQSNTDYSIVIDNLKHSFQEENFLNPRAASYLVDCYAYALGLIAEVEQDIADEEDLDHEGEPAFVVVEDGEFCGYRNNNNERCGFGILKELDGGYYAGEWNLNMRMGVGIRFSRSRQKYAGQWRLNNPHGIGMELQENGTVYSGSWKNGKKNGFGTLFFPNGECLSIVFADDKIANTTGIWLLQDGSYIQGKMTLRGPTGLCFHTLTNGTIVEEYWDNGKLLKNTVP